MVRLSPSHAWHIRCLNSRERVHRLEDVMLNEHHGHRRKLFVMAVEVCAIAVACNDTSERRGPLVVGTPAGGGEVVPAPPAPPTPIQGPADASSENTTPV